MRTKLIALFVTVALSGCSAGSLIVIEEPVVEFEEPYLFAADELGRLWLEDVDD